MVGSGYYTLVFWRIAYQGNQENIGLFRPELRLNVDIGLQGFGFGVHLESLNLN
jgi:hypothetical protein